MAWFSKKPKVASGGCHCGDGPATMDHLRLHVVEITTTRGEPGLAYNCPICGISEDLWNREEEGRAGVRAGLLVHLFQTHGISS